MIGLIFSTEPPFPPKCLGKLVEHDGEVVYSYDGVKPFYGIRAFGVAKCVLMEMLRHDIQRIYFTSGEDGVCYMATRDDVLADGFEAAPGQRRGYIYMRLKLWQPVARPLFRWVPASECTTLPWLVDAPELDAERERVLALRPVRAPEPVQERMWL